MPSQFRGEADGNLEKIAQHKEEQREEVIEAEVLAIRWQERRDGDAGDEGGQSGFGAQWQESHRSQTGNRDWALGSEKRGEEGSREKVVARRWESELHAQFSVSDSCFQDLGSNRRVVACSSSVHVKGKGMPRAYDLSRFDCSLP